MSFNGAIALAASAMDPRVSFVIACCPWLNYFAKETVPRVYAAAAQDRRSRLSGNKPSLVPVVTEDGGSSFNLPASEARKSYRWIQAAVPEGIYFPNHVTPYTLASLAKWSVKPYIEHGIAAPVMIMVPELDESFPAKQQLELFDHIKGPKLLHLAKGRDHLGILGGPDMRMRQKLQVDFVRDAIGGKYRSML